MKTVVTGSLFLTALPQTLPSLLLMLLKRIAQLMLRLVCEFTFNTYRLDEESLYADHIAAILRRFNPRQKALARVQIDQVLFNIEFPSTES